MGNMLFEVKKNELLFWMKCVGCENVPTKTEFKIPVSIALR